MKAGPFGSAAAGVFALLLACGAALAQSPPQPPPPEGPTKPDQRIAINPGPAPRPPAKVDITKVDMYYADPAHANIAGLWRPANGPRPYYYVEGKLIPLKGANLEQVEFPYRPEWQKVLDARYQGEHDNLPYGDPSAGCWPQGMWHNYIGYGSPVEITETPGMVRIINERMTPVRRVFTDGRLHPANFVATSEGHSIGHWEADTLVIDTVKVRPEFTFGYHMPHSSQVHFVERIRRLDAETLAIYVNIDDPIALTKPVETVLYYKLGPPQDKMSEDFCVENNRNQPDENLIVRVDIGPHKHYGFDLPEDK
jgi:hypothetical protein